MRSPSGNQQAWRVNDFPIRSACRDAHRAVAHHTQKEVGAPRRTDFRDIKKQDG